MGDEYLSRTIPYAVYPPEQFALVGMRGKSVYLSDFGSNTVGLSQDSNFVFPMGVGSE